MTVVIPPPDVPSAPSRSFQPWPFAFVSLLVLALVGVAVALAVVDRQYGPPEAGNFGGIVTLSSFSGEFPPYRLTTDSGQLMASMQNHGSRPIKITSMDTADSVSRIQWSSYRVVDGGDISGMATPWQSFPATIPAHGTIRLLFTVRRLSPCPAKGDVSADFNGFVTVHWRSLLFRHTTTVDTMDQTEAVLC